MTERQKIDRALLRLECFKALDGWGSTTKTRDSSIHVTWDMERRRQEAEELADWALGETS